MDDGTLRSILALSAVLLLGSLLRALSSWLVKRKNKWLRWLGQPLDGAAGGPNKPDARWYHD